MIKTTLGEISINGKGEYGIGASAVEYSSDLYTYLRITDINDDGTINKNGLKSVVDENADKYILQKNDIVFARTGASTGKNYFYEEKDGTLVYAGFLIKFSLDENKVNPKFIKYYCLSQVYKDWVYSMVLGSTRGNINAKIFAELPIVLPERDYQNSAVKILSALDEKIELNNKINENLHAQAQAIFSEYYNKGTEKLLGDVVNEIESGSRQKGGAVNEGVPSIGAEKIEQFGIYDFSKEKYISNEFFNKLKKGVIKNGDVLLYKDGAYTGKVSMALNGFPYEKCAVNEHVFIIRGKENYINQFYLYFCLFDSDNKAKIHSLASSKVAQPGLNQEELKSLIVKVPGVEDMLNFEKTVSPMMNIIAYNAIQNQKLAQIRDTLLPKLMSGELEV